MFRKYDFSRSVLPIAGIVAGDVAAGFGREFVVGVDVDHEPAAGRALGVHFRVQRVYASITGVE